MLARQTAQHVTLGFWVINVMTHPVFDSQVIVVLSDGLENEGLVADTARRLRSEGFHIVAVSLGNPNDKVSCCDIYKQGVYSYSTPPPPNKKLLKYVFLPMIYKNLQNTCESLSTTVLVPYVLNHFIDSSNWNSDIGRSRIWCNLASSAGILPQPPLPSDINPIWPSLGMTTITA